MLSKFILLPIISIILYVELSNADCCLSQFIYNRPGYCKIESDYAKSQAYIYGVCSDCTFGTPYCGYGKCNIFGCNCDGGCRRPPSGTIYDLYQDGIPEKVMFDRMDYDKNKFITVGEFWKYYLSKDYTDFRLGLSDAKLTEYYHAIDTDKDGKISYEEFINAPPAIII